MMGRSRVVSGPVERVTETYSVIHSNRMNATIAAAQLNGGQRLDCKQVVVQAHPDNGGRVFVGNAMRQDVILVPGQSYTIPVCDVTLVWVRASAGVQVVNWNAVDL